MITKTIHKEYHHGHPVLREAKPIEIARIPITDDTWQGSIVLHPRYVPKSVPHELVHTRAYRRGRSIDIFLDNPIENDGEAYGILNFKGTGADADRDLIIHPRLWWRWNQWVAREYGDFHNRFWGAVMQEDGEEEFTNPILERANLPYSPQVQLHPLPRELSKKIAEREGGFLEWNLSQLLRAQKTNIRCIDKLHLTPEVQRRYARAEVFAEIDARFIQRVLELAQEGKRIRVLGDFASNRLIDGTFTDLENYTEEEFMDIDDAAVCLGTLLANLITETESSLPSEERQVYRTILETETKLPLPYVEPYTMFREAILNACYQR